MLHYLAQIKPNWSYLKAHIKQVPPQWHIPPANSIKATAFPDAKIYKRNHITMKVKVPWILFSFFYPFFTCLLVKVTQVAP